MKAVKLEVGHIQVKSDSGRIVQSFHFSLSPVHCIYLHLSKHRKLIQPIKNGE